MTATRIEVLGSGCAKCEMLAKHAEEAARELGLDHTLVKVTDPTTFMRYGVMATPALVVDGRLRLQGRVPSADKLKDLLRQP
ncbi:MAG: thioredoxin family protein [Gemmatimonadales bacterium]